MKIITAIILTITMLSCSNPMEDEVGVFKFPYIKLEQSDGYSMDDLIAELQNMKRPLTVARECYTPQLEITLPKGLNQNGHNLELINTHLIAYGSKKKGNLILKCGAKVTVKKPKKK